MAGLCVGWEVYKAGWKVCCWEVFWWQLAMAGLCGVVGWAMEGACVHLVSKSGVLSFALSLVKPREAAMGCEFRVWPTVFWALALVSLFF